MTNPEIGKKIRIKKEMNAMMAAQFGDGEITRIFPNNYCAVINKDKSWTMTLSLNELEEISA